MVRFCSKNNSRNHQRIAHPSGCSMIIGIVQARLREFVSDTNFYVKILIDYIKLGAQDWNLMDDDESNSSGQRKIPSQNAE